MTAGPSSEPSASHTGGTPLLELRGVTKEFPGTLANDSVDLVLQAGEIHALLGENGAGKSTLVKIIYGVLGADAGHILWQGQPVHIAGPAAARRLGIGMVFQHFSLFEAMTVLENIALAMPDDRDMNALRQRVQDVSATYGLPLAPDRHVHDLSVGERQRIEIVRCLLQDPKLIILDEPTSVLTPQETDGLFATLRQLAGEGRAILYISHKLAEVEALCHRATVLRGGRVVAERDPRTTNPREMAEIMVGERLNMPERSSAGGDGRVRLQVEGLSMPAPSEFGTALDNIAFSVKAGEIVGIAGVAGNGQGELMAARIAATAAILVAGYLGIYPPGFVAQVVAFAFVLAAASLLARDAFVALESPHVRTPTTRALARRVHPWLPSISAEFAGDNANDLRDAATRVATSRDVSASFRADFEARVRGPLSRNVGPAALVAAEALVLDTEATATLTPSARSFRAAPRQRLKARNCSLLRNAFAKREARPTFAAKAALSRTRCSHSKNAFARRSRENRATARWTNAL